MKKLEKAMKVMTWLAWGAFVYGIATLETPTAGSCVCLVMAAAWIITTCFLKEELTGDER